MYKVKKLIAVTSSVNVSIFMLTLITAGAHLYLAAQPDEALRFWFLLNGLGYLVILTAYFWPLRKSFHRIVGWGMLGYVLLTVVLWFFLGSLREGTLDPFDATVKAVEITLAVQLFLDMIRNCV